MPSTRVLNLRIYSLVDRKLKEFAIWWMVKNVHVDRISTLGGLISGKDLTCFSCTDVLLVNVENSEPQSLSGICGQFLSGTYFHHFGAQTERDRAHTV